MMSAEAARLVAVTGRGMVNRQVDVRDRDARRDLVADGDGQPLTLLLPVGYAFRTYAGDR
jgi:hypothetical protein